MGRKSNAELVGILLALDRLIRRKSSASARVEPPRIADPINDLISDARSGRRQQDQLVCRERISCIGT